MKARTKLILQLAFWVLMLVFIIAIPEVGVIAAIIAGVCAVYGKARNIPIIKIKKR